MKLCEIQSLDHLVLSFANGQSKFIIYENVRRATLSQLPCELFGLKGVQFFMTPAFKTFLWVVLFMSLLSQYLRICKGRARFKVLL